MRVTTLFALLLWASWSAQGAGLAAVSGRFTETAPTATPAVDCSQTPEVPECAGDVPDEANADPFAGDAVPLAADQPLELDNSGVLDGIYQCEMRYGTRTEVKSQAYVSVNGKRNGDAIFIVGEVDARPDAYFGWGIGRVEKATDGITFTFFGNTSESQPFTLTGTFQEDGSIIAKGETVVMFNTTDSSQKVGVKVQVGCQSIW